MSNLQSYIDTLLSTDLATLGVICVLCAIAGYFIKDLLVHPPVILLIFPVMVAVSLSAYHLFSHLQQFNSKKMDQWLTWTILACICGTVLGVILMTVVAALRERIASRRPRAPTKTGRAIRRV